MIEETVDDAMEAFDALIEEENISRTNVSVESVNVEAAFDALVDTNESPAADTLVGASVEAFESTENIEESSESSESSESFGVPEESCIIPVNSREKVLEDNVARFKGAAWFEKIKEQYVTIIGQGGIGSWVSLAIARLNVQHMYIYDPDTVEAVNMAGQMFGTADIGTSKVSAVYDRIMSLCGYLALRCYNASYNEYESPTPIMIGALDNMEARKIIYNSWKKYYKENASALFIDGRLSADEFQIFAIKGGETDKMKIYEDKWLFSQAESEPTQCSFKQTTYMAMMIASFIANRLVNHCANLVDPDAMYDAPFYINYNSEIGFFKTSEI